MPHTQTEAEEILAPHMPTLGEIFPAAWDDWEAFGENCPDLRLKVCKRTRATMLNNFAACAAEQRFAGMGPAVTLTDKPGFLLIIFESALHVRIKKYTGTSYGTCGIATTQRHLYETQQPITGFPDSSNCVLGYVLREDASGYAETLIKCSTGKNVHWTIDIPLGGEGGTIATLPQPTGELPEPGITSTIEEEKDTETGGIGD